jgi:molybdopterin-synthase adenylyltransferase
MPDHPATKPADQLARYHRQMLLPGFGADGQRRLLGATALVLGCGALGTVAADLLARAGVGHLRIVDRDFIELSNLQRQVLFDERDVADAMPKAEAARRRIARINSQVRSPRSSTTSTTATSSAYAAGADVIVDGLDNFETRYLANDCAVKHGMPYVYGGAVGTAGMAYAILPHTRSGDAPWEPLAPAATGRRPACAACSRKRRRPARARPATPPA